MSGFGGRLAAGCLGVALSMTGMGVLEAASGAVTASPAQESPRFLWGAGAPMYLVTSDMAPHRTLAETAATPNVPLWSGSFTYQTRNFAYTMVGTDPALGSATTTIPVVIVPLKIIFYGPLTTLSASNPVCGDSMSATTLALDSPLFQAYPFLPGGTDVGTTQYIDAFQRANFWSDVSTTAPDYHVLLSPTVAPTQTILVPKFLGSTVAGPCSRIGKVSFLYFDLVLRRMIDRLAIPPTSLPLFVAYNTFLTQGGQCCVLGYHSARSGGQTYAFASYNDAGVFNVPIQDIHAMSHELAEWLDDPFGVNPTPGWKGGQAVNCQFNLEVGDPVTGIAFEAPLGGTTYHPEDLVFLPWFARESPSSSVNGWYTFLDTYASPPAACP
jgi:hypothetical protein